MTEHVLNVVHRSALLEPRPAGRFVSEIMKTGGGGGEPWACAPDRGSSLIISSTARASAESAARASHRSLAFSALMVSSFRVGLMSAGITIRRACSRSPGRQ